MLFADAHRRLASAVTHLVVASVVMTSFPLYKLQEVTAGFLASQAGLGADTAVLVPISVPLALIATALAKGRTGCQQERGSAVICSATGDADGGSADIGAVQAQADAVDHLSHVLLVQVSIGVSGAGLGTVVERLNGCGQGGGVDAEVTWMGVQHLRDVPHGPSSEGDRENPPSSICI
jgi:hypothetical protein